jgi:hypothetical protein
MPFPKGTSGNPNGRPQGAEGKIQREKKERITGLLAVMDPDVPQVMAELRMSKPDVWIKTYIDLLEYVSAKLSRQDVTIETKDPIIVTIEVAELKDDAGDED